MRTLRFAFSVATAACVLAPLAHAHDSPAAVATTLHALVDAAWQRVPLASTLAARRQETGAARDLAASWLASAPTLGVSDRSDRWTDGRGQRETELSLSAPLVLPAQHGARQRLAARADDELDAQLAQARLDVAGEVRARLWEAELARAVLAEQEDHVTHLEELAADVEQRVKAGELARSDALLARQEVLAAVGARVAARDRAGAALARFRLLTGATALPDLAPEPLPGTVVQTVPATVHPRLLAAQAAQARAQATVAVASANRHAGPTLGVATRRERDGGVPGVERSIGVSLQIPLSGQLRNRPAEALAGTQLATASAELAQAQAAVEIDLALARERLANARAALDAAAERAAALREHTALFRQAYELGEKPLADLLRSRALTHEAEVALRQKRIALAQAHSQLNQASGIVP
ncbi:TolC family protein [Pseudoduganella chitinolytica]|uniref:TolC family protein n=1 Tax=Pseudoduganella chitinolytica TaxID=34070 RepID=A0ABY8BE13_9BURK|nr:TolC family protein [Pseudoduganella chitinolytica]WEF32962.1 TolC family protein [Pseudoduganella chitinolytica]